MTDVIGPTGEGYRPDQVDEALHRLGEDRDSAWERAARLTVLAREMERELAGLTARMAEFGRQTYADLGDGAVTLFEMARAEADAVRAAGRAEADAVTDAASRAAALTHEAARAAAGEVLAEAEAHWRSVTGAAQAEADELLAAARTDAEAVTGEADRALAEVRRRAAATLADTEAKEAAAARADQGDLREREAAWERDLAGRTERAHHRVEAAQNAYAQAGRATAAKRQASEVRAAEIVAEAGVIAERVELDTERRLRAVGERCEAIRAHLDYVRTGLATITFRPPPEGAGGSVPSPSPSADG
ncbi:hypothetical protein SRB5_70470 [Streptomyces sp. RB5]|uniref:Cellulose-binding protein n=1 Tax=Streptomyces smaragdinus TaxID=2585196 RepID=A0A7K0CW08_9ACTN|nr:cellulose-binding protein [Streptomyces smaragdinus]MQY16844.1 hypothetical protein [Streptomyces smaragdinus]